MEIFKKFRLKLALVGLTFFGVPCVVLSVLLLIAAVMSTSESAVLFSLAAIAILFLILNIIGVCILSGIMSRRVVDFCKRLSDNFTPEEFEAIRKSAGGKSYLMLTSSMVLYGEKKADSDKLVRMVNEYVAADDCSSDISWHKEKGSEHFLLNIPDVWRKNYPMLMYGKAVRLFEYVDRSALLQFKTVFARCEDEKDRSFEIQVPLKIAPDRVIRVLIRGKSLIGDNGSIMTVGCITDVDSTLRLEKAIRENFAMYSFALESVSDVIYQVDLDNGTFYIANLDRWNEMLGLHVDSERFDDFSRLYQSRIHPDYREAYLDRFFNYDHILLLPNKSLSFEYRVQNSAGDYIWVNQTVLVIGENGEMAQRLICRIRNINEKKREELKIVYRSNLDSLTGTYLRSAVKREFELVMKRGNPHIAVMIIDVDQLSSINNNYGITVGDLALRCVAKTIWAKQLTSCAVGRLDDDEFVLVEREVTDKARPERMAELLIDKFKEPALLENGKTINLTVSIGLIEYEGNDGNYEELLEKARIAMQSVKENGGGGFAVYAEQGAL